MANQLTIWMHARQTSICGCQLATAALTILLAISIPTSALGQSTQTKWSKRQPAQTEPVTLGLPQVPPAKNNDTTDLWNPRKSDTNHVNPNTPSSRGNAFSNATRSLPTPDPSQPSHLPQVPTQQLQNLYRQNQTRSPVTRPVGATTNSPAWTGLSPNGPTSGPRLSNLNPPEQPAPNNRQHHPITSVRPTGYQPATGLVTPASGQSLAEMAIPGLDSGKGTPKPSPRANSSESEGLDILPNDLLGGGSSGTRSGVLPKDVDAAVNSRYQQELDAAALKNSAVDALPPSLLGGGSNGTPPELIPRPDPQSNSSDAVHNSVLGIPSNLPSLNGATGMQQPAKPKPLKAPKYSGLPEYIEPFGKIKGPHIDALSTQVPYDPHAFIPSPMAPCPIDPNEELNIYRGKFPVPVQRPIVELWRPLFPKGLLPPARNWFGKYNLVMPHFMVYGDFRTGVGVNRNQNGDANSLAFRANLDMDLELTATERIHAFMGPLDRGGEFTRLDFSDDAVFLNRSDIRLDTLFFEGDAGAIWGGLTNQDGPFDLPFSLGLIPFFYQNGIWAADAAMGAAVAIPAKHSKLLKWSNFDATFFWASDQVTTDAFAGDNNAAEFFGTAWFIEAYDGYFEVDYAFVHDDVGEHRSYHNFSVAFTKRYFHRVSNSIRLITNFNQSLPRDQRTAEGHLLLIENALMTSSPNTFVPYANFFYGQGRVQSLARAGGTGILNNTGINFESDGLTGYPTLDFTGHNTVGGAVGLNLLGKQFSQQLVLEFAGLAANGSQQFRNARGDQYAFGIRYQKPLNNAWIFRTDHMFGFLRGDDDIRGSRIELRWKF
ncbi:MAG: hypothetical protein ACE361_20850 [Aureliella sp.]